MKIGDLKKIIKQLPDDTEILYNDPNFSGPYHYGPDADSFKIEDNKLLISFPFESPVS